MTDIGIVHRYFRARLGEFAQNQFAAAVTRIPHILAVTRIRQQDPRTRYIPAHVAQRVVRELRRVQSARVIDVDSCGAHLEHAITILKTQDVFVGPIAQPAVFRQTVPANALAGKDYVAVCWPGFDGPDDFREIHPVAFRKD